jgi:hypothetical protein
VWVREARHTLTGESESSINTISWSIFLLAGVLLVVLCVAEGAGVLSCMLCVLAGVLPCMLCAWAGVLPCMLCALAGVLLVVLCVAEGCGAFVGDGVSLLAVVLSCMLCVADGCGALVGDGETTHVGGLCCLRTSVNRGELGVGTKGKVEACGGFGATRSSGLLLVYAL